MMGGVADYMSAQVRKPSLPQAWPVIVPPAIAFAAGSAPSSSTPTAPMRTPSMPITC